MGFAESIEISTIRKKGGTNYAYCLDYWYVSVQTCDVIAYYETGIC